MEELIELWRSAVQLEWRVACVRIPRFPIGAVQRARQRDAEAKGSAQLLLPMERTEECCSTVKSDVGGGMWDVGRPPTSDLPRPTHWDELPIVLTDGASTRPKLRAAAALAARSLGRVLAPSVRTMGSSSQ